MEFQYMIEMTFQTSEEGMDNRINGVEANWKQPRTLYQTEFQMS